MASRKHQQGLRVGDRARSKLNGRIGTVDAVDQIEGQRRYGLRLTRSHRTVEAHAASTPLARDLGIPRHAPVLKLTNVSFGADNRPVETFVAYHRGDRSRFEVELERAPAGRAVPPLVRVL